MAAKDKKASPKKTLGRPSVMTDEVIKKLEEGFSMGFSDLEACLYAGITKTPFYNYQEDHPEFKERKDMLKGQVKMHAKRNLAQDIRNGDVDSAKWALERLDKKTYSTRTDITSDGEAITPSLEVSFIGRKKG